MNTAVQPTHGGPVAGGAVSPPLAAPPVLFSHMRPEGRILVVCKYQAATLEQRNTHPRVALAGLIERVRRHLRIVRGPTTRRVGFSFLGVLAQHSAKSASRIFQSLRSPFGKLFAHSGNNAAKGIDGATQRNWQNRQSHW